MKGECSCWIEYPNELCKRKNTWKCVDKYECIKQLEYRENGRAKHKTVCRKKEKRNENT